MSYWRCRCKFIAIYPDIRTICAIRYASTIRYSIFDDVYRVRDTQQQKRAQARNTCVHVRRAWENVLYFVFSRFEFNIYPINCTNCISIEDETQRRLLSLSQLISALISLIKCIGCCVEKAQFVCVCLQLTSVMAIRDTHTHTYKHTHTYGVT